MGPNPAEPSTNLSVLAECFPAEPCKTQPNRSQPSRPQPNQAQPNRISFPTFFWGEIGPIIFYSNVLGLGMDLTGRRCARLGWVRLGFAVKDSAGAELAVLGLAGPEWARVGTETG